jgi:hypothetical protein
LRQRASAQAEQYIKEERQNSTQYTPRSPAFRPSKLEVPAAERH